MAKIINVSVGGSAINVTSADAQTVKVKTASNQKVGISPGTVTVVGKSPYINEETGTWMVYNDQERAYVDSGVAAESLIQGVSEEFVIDENGELQVYNIAMDKIDGLSDFIGNSIRGVSVDGLPLPVVEGVVDIPVADDIIAGLVRSSDGENSVTVDADGTMFVNSLNVNRLTQTAGERFTLNAGNSTD